MKKIIFILIIIPFLFSCSDDEKDEKTQNYTSFVFEQTVNNDLPNCVAGYKKDGKYYKIAELGYISLGKPSKEIIIEDNLITEVYFFTDYMSPRKFDATYKLTKNKKNIFKLLEATKGILITDKSDPTQYPQ